MTSEKGFNRWFVVLGAVLIQLALGAIYAWSVFTPSLKGDKYDVVSYYSPSYLGLDAAAASELDKLKKKRKEVIKKVIAVSSAVKKVNRGETPQPLEMSQGITLTADDIRGMLNNESLSDVISTLSKKVKAQSNREYDLFIEKNIKAETLSKNTFSYSNTMTQAIFSAGLAFFAIVMVVAGKQMKNLGPRKLAIMGGLVLGGGYLSIGLLGDTSFWSIMFFIGIMGGAGIGLAYVVPIAVGMKWFPDKKGMITGLAVAGFGFGALGWVKLAGAWGHLIQNIGIFNTFALYGILFMVMVAGGGFFMVFPPDGWKPEGWEESSPGTPAAAITTPRDFESMDMLKTRNFYMIWLTFLFGASAGLMAIGLMKLYPMEALQKNGMSPEAASAVAGTAMAVFFSLANGLGRIGWGILSDKLGRKKSIVIMTALQGIVFIIFTYMAGNQYLLYLGATLIGFNFGGNFALFPAITADTFGTKNVGNNYPFVFLSYGVGGIAGPIMGGKLGDMGNFAIAFTILGVACIVGALLISTVKKPQPA